MPVVKVDEKGRIQLPKVLRHELGLKVRQSLVVQRQGELLTVSKVGRTNSKDDPLLREFIQRPLRGGKLSKKMLDEIEDTMWLP